MTGKAASGDDSLLAQTRGLMHRFGIGPRKRLGQHFLIDRGVLVDIISSAGMTSEDIVVEVGPGLGVLTRELARQAGWVITVELDDKLAGVLKQILEPFNNITIINQDILKVAPATLLEEFRARLPAANENSSSYKVIANLPYYITSPVLRHFLEASVRPEVMVVMVQKEVADTIVAGPGETSLLSISVQLYGKPEIVRYVPSDCFYPAPEVDSAIVRINLYPQPVVDLTDVQGFFEMVRAGFSAPRKQIVNSLAKGLQMSKEDALSLLEINGIASRRRAQTLTIDEWSGLWQAYSEREKED